MRKYICDYAGCNILLDDKGYCDKHIQFQPRPFSNAVRSNEGEYSSYKWKKLRQHILSLTPFCCMCGGEKNLQAHHIIAPRGNMELFYDAMNIQIICRGCHMKETQREIAKRRVYG